MRAYVCTKFQNHILNNFQNFSKHFPNFSNFSKLIQISFWSDVESTSIADKMTMKSSLLELVGFLIKCSHCWYFKECFIQFSPVKNWSSKSTNGQFLRKLVKNGKIGPNCEVATLKKISSYPELQSWNAEQCTTDHMKSHSMGCCLPLKVIHTLDVSNF